MFFGTRARPPHRTSNYHCRYQMEVLSGDKWQQFFYFFFSSKLTSRELSQKFVSMYVRVKSQRILISVH